MKYLKTHLVFVGLFLCSFIGLACYCGGKKGISQEIKLRDVIVEGKILSKDSIMLVDSIALKMNEKFKDVVRESGMVYFPVVKYTVAVDTAFKGKTSDTINIFTSAGYGNCGMERKVNSDYIFYLNNDHRNSDKTHIFPKGSDTYWILGCTRTILVNNLEKKKLTKALK